MSVRSNSSSIFELFETGHDHKCLSSRKTVAIKRKLFDIVSSPDETLKKKRKKATRNKAKHRKTRHYSRESNSHPLLRGRTFSEFDDYELIIEEDKSPRRLDWVFIEEKVEPSKEYLELMRQNWKLAKQMEKQRIPVTVGKEVDAPDKSCLGDVITDRGDASGDKDNGGDDNPAVEGDDKNDYTDDDISCAVEDEIGDDNDDDGDIDEYYRCMTNDESDDDNNVIT